MGGKRTTKKCKGNKSGIKKISQVSEKIMSGRVDTKEGTTVCLLAMEFGVNPIFSKKLAR